MLLHLSLYGYAWLKLTKVTYIELRRNTFDIVLQNKFRARFSMFPVTYPICDGLVVPDWA